MKRLRWLVIIAALAFCAAPARADYVSWWWGVGDPLSQRDEYGRLHQSKAIDEPDLAQRESWRLFYYNKSREQLVHDPAYIGALQVALRRTGYYCGAIDGVFSPDVMEAITHLQKNYHMRVTGNLTVAVRRALRLP
jgi:hypothetical protein